MKKFVLFLVVTGTAFAGYFWYSSIYRSNTGELLRIYPEKETDILELQVSEKSFLETLGFVRNPSPLSLFDGLPMSNSTDSPIAVMIENSTPARPQQAGLSQASVVYETLAEGGITRFMAVFAHQSPERAGPVRSLRPYYLEWAKEHAHAIVHAGGSEEALEKLAYSHLTNVDEFDTGISLSRDPNYPKPHNLFADISKVRANETEHKNNWFGMPFIFGTTTQNNTKASHISINFGIKEYSVSYDYNPSTGRYERIQDGVIHKDAGNGEILSPTNILVQFAPIEQVDDYGRLHIKTQGSGHALLFMQNGVWKATWKYENGVTKFFDEQGNILTVTPGQTWITVIDSPEKVTYRE